MAHNFQRNTRGINSSETDDIDPVDRLLNKTGCADLHYQVQVWKTYNKLKARYLMVMLL